MAFAGSGSNSTWKPQRDEAYLKGENTALLMSDLLSRCNQGARSVRELDNWINLNWWMGRPYYQRVPTTTSVVGLNPRSRSNFVYANLAFDAVRALVGVMAYPPKAEASPKTDDQEDIARAHVDAEVANAAIQNGGLEDAYASVLRMNHMYGHGWVKCPWNPLGGSKMPQMNQVPCPQCRGKAVIYDAMQQPKACPQCTAQGVQPAPQHQEPAPPGFITQFQGMKPEGDVAFIPVHPDDIFTDPDAKNPGEAEEIIHQIRMSPETAWRMYGEHLGIPQEVFDHAPNGDSVNQGYMSNNAAQMMRPSNQRYIAVREYYGVPTGKHPMGLFSIALGELEIYAGPLPYLHDNGQWHPFFYFPMYAADELYYPMSTLDLVLPLIITYNEHLSLKNSRAKLSAKLRMKYAEQMRMRLDESTGHMVYLGRPGLETPQPVQLAPYPQDAQDMQEVLLQMIDRLSGATDVVRGQTQNADSARALTFLEEKAIGPLQPIINKHASVLDRLIRYAVDICRIFYDDGRIIRVMGAQSSASVFEFHSEQVGTADVKLVSVRDVGRSRASKMEELTEAFKDGAITVDEFKEYSQYGGTDQMRLDMKAQADLAMQENKSLLRNGFIAEPLPGQKHKIHNQVHDKKINEMSMRNPQDPLIPWLVAHRQMHVKIEAMEMIAPQMEEQMAMANYGRANAADGAAQPQATQAKVNALPAGAASAPPGVTPSAEPFAGAAAAPPGESQQYQENAAQARSYDR